jgi:hypothetical protein
MDYDKKQLKEPMKPLYGFDGKKIEPVGMTTLPVSFGTPKNPCTEHITFNIVGMLYPYNAIFSRGPLNTLRWLYTQLSSTSKYQPPSAQ